jgi:nucleoside 2-deoxyribosyltransferase
LTNGQLCLIKEGKTMRKFYVASNFKNIDTVRYVSNELINKGYIQTYDWTKNERASTLEKLKEIGQQERNAVMEADFIIVLLPAGKGSHIEFGIALGQGKKIYLYSQYDEVNKFETTSTFYLLSEVEKCIGTIEELIATVTK